MISEQMRENGLNAIKTVVNSNEFSKLVEKNIYKISSTDEEYGQYIMQIVGDVMNKVKVSIIIENIQKGNIGWNHTFYDEMRKLIEEQDDFIQNPIEIEEGAIQCNCGSMRVFSYSKQCKSSDEGMTTFANCVACGSKWQYAG